MARQIKTWGGTLFYGDAEHPHKQYRVLVAFGTKKEALAAIHSKGCERIGAAAFNDHFFETGNNVELTVTAGQTGMWVACLDHHDRIEDYKKIQY